MMLGMTTAMGASPIGWVPDGDFSDRLALVRSRMGWNYSTAGERCGIDGEAWVRWELEGRKPQDFESVCKRVSEGSGCNLVWLMTGQANSYSEPPKRTRRRKSGLSAAPTDIRIGYRNRRTSRPGIVPAWGLPTHQAA